jgi:AGCS family alanine or glycine:cation symporter
MIVCTTTGLVLLMTGAWQQLDLQSTNMVTYAFDIGLGSLTGSIIVMVSLILFGYTTVMAWACCAERAVAYLWGIRYGKWAKLVYIALIPLGAVIRVDLAWVLADICITAMLFINIIGIAALSKEVIADSNAYFKEELEIKRT